MSGFLRQVTSRVSRTSPLLTEARRLGRRHAHMPRPLPYPIEEGLGNFLPPQSLQTLVDYQDGLLERLNQELRTDTKAEKHSSVAQIALTYSERKERTLPFNYAVLAWNNSFFLDNLTPPPPEESGFTNHQHKISDNLLSRIRQHYNDFPNLKSAFSAAALGMFTNGWVWMVTDAHGNLGVLPTFGPSTLLIRSRMNVGTSSLLFREPQGVDPEGPLSPDAETPSNYFSNGPTTPPGVGVTSPTSGISSRSPGLSGFPPEPHARAYSNGYSNLSMELLSPNSFTGNTFNKDDAAGRKEKSLSAGDCLYPLFCIPTYEHAWMSAGFGVWGKETWLKEFWTVLDWEKVSKLYHDARNRTAKL